MVDEPTITIYGKPIDCIIKNLWFQIAKEQDTGYNNGFKRVCLKASTLLPTPEEWKELEAEFQKLDEAEFQKHKIKKEDIFDDISKAPKWLEDEFAIYDIIEVDNIEYGKFKLVPYDLIKKCQKDMFLYGTYFYSIDTDEKYRKVVMIKGKKND